jgi:hypothetical protein
MLIVGMVISGFTVGRYERAIYLQENESIYISKHGHQVYMWVYTHDPDTGAWEIEQVENTLNNVTVLNVHFVK